MHVLIWIAVFSCVASAGVVLLMALVYRRAVRSGVPLNLLLSFAVGTLLSSALLGLLPAALEAGNYQRVLAGVLVGFIAFFALEKSLLWRHSHGSDLTAGSLPGPLIIIGDAFHNFVDGVVIASAFVMSIPAGIGASLAIIAHEIPQEIGDFAILEAGGYTQSRALGLNCLSAATTPVGALLGYLVFSNLREVLPYVLAVSAASFLYIGVADLIPSLRIESRPSSSVAQFAALMIGVLTIAALVTAMAS